jgi:DNA ligase 1
VTVHYKLYHRDTKGRLRVWWVEREHEKYRIWDGLDDGNPKASEWTTCVGKNTGKANATAPHEQCLIEVLALYTQKLDRKYHKTPECNDPKPFFPMLAKTFEGWDKLPIEHTLPANLIQVYTQPKLDGVRCIATKDGLQSREGKPLALPHITAALKTFFEAFPNVVLDGELYHHDLKEDLGEIVSLVRRGDSRLQYHVYDHIARTPENFAGRSNWLMILDRYTTLPIVRVQTHIVPNRYCLDTLYEKFLSQGYEGQMVRTSSFGTEQGYEPGKRSGFLLKRKEFRDAEFKLLRLEEGRGNYAGCAKRAVLLTEDGKEFGAGVKGKRETLQDHLTMFEQHGLAPDAKATVKFFSLTPDGIPRFPVVTQMWPWGRDL